MFAASKHADVRVRQRGIPPLVVEWLLSYGTSHYDHHRGEWFYFDAPSRQRLMSAIGAESLARHSDHLDCYAVLSIDGSIITVGHRTRRFKLDFTERFHRRRRIFYAPEGKRG
jgi:hypothetical protein